MRSCRGRPSGSGSCCRVRGRGLLTGLVVAVALVAYRRRAGAATFFESATVIAFAAAAILHLDHGQGPLLADSFAALAAIWALAAAVRPLGLSGEYARWNYVAPLAGTALFRYPNVLITLAWAGAFLVNAALAAAGRRWPLPGAIVTTLHVSIFATCALFTTRRERGAGERRIEDIDRRLEGWRRAGWVAAGLAALLLASLAIPG